MEEAGETQQLGFVAGVVERERILGFERMLWRISRGNVFLRQADIETPFTDPKTVIIFYFLSQKEVQGFRREIFKNSSIKN